MGGRPRTGTGVGEKENCLPCLGSSVAGAELGPGEGAEGVEGEPENDDGGSVGEKDGGGGEDGEDSEKEVENLESGVAADTTAGDGVTEGDGDC